MNEEDGEMQQTFAASTDVERWIESFGVAYEMFESVPIEVVDKEASLLADSPPAIYPDQCRQRSCALTPPTPGGVPRCRPEQRRGPFAFIPGRIRPATPQHPG